MQDKSSYSSNNKPQIPEGLQNFINAMAEEIVLKGEAFDEQKKKWLKKYSEAEGVNYPDLEANLKDFFELLDDFKKSQSNAFKRMLTNHSTVCFIDNMLLNKLLFHQPQIILTHDTQFKTVKIGNQIWMAENLNVDKFRNGDPIPEARTNEEWQRAGKNKQPAWCYYDNDPANGEIHGKLYNWYSVADKRRITQEGFIIPNFISLNYLLRQYNVSGAIDLIDSFSIKFSGNRDNYGHFLGFDHNIVFWSSSSHGEDDAYRLYVQNEIFGDPVNMNIESSPKSQGYYIRCLKR